VIPQKKKEQSKAYDQTFDLGEGYLMCAKDTKPNEAYVPPLQIKYFNP
jgi:hypothetical protein